MITILLAGHFNSFWSAGSVTRGLQQGLSSNLKNYEIVPANIISYAPIRNDVKDGYDEFYFETDVRPNTSYDFLLFYGYPIVGARYIEYLEKVLNVSVKHKMGYLITESSLVPRGWLWALEQFDKIFVPSDFVRCAFIDSRLHYQIVQKDNVEYITVVHHGFDDVYIQAAYDDYFAPDIDEDNIRFLHIAGARDFLERKGTQLLMNAFCDFVRYYKTATLTLRIPKGSRLAAYSQFVNEKISGDAILLDEHDNPLQPNEMLQYYRSGWTAVVQPSRAEAFGLIPGESICSGIRCLRSYCTGHKVYPYGIHTCIDVGTSEPIRVQGIQEGLAPAIAISAIHAGLCRVLNSRVTRNQRIEYAESFNWSTTVKPLCNYILQRS